MRIFLVSLRPALVLALLAAAAAARAGDDLCNAQDFGGLGDGSRVETAAIQRAIDACAQTGGTAYLPRGTWRSGTLYLASAMELKLGAGARLVAEPDLSLYPEQAVPGGDPFRALLVGASLRDFVLSGPGTIDGQG